MRPIWQKTYRTVLWGRIRAALIEFIQTVYLCVVLYLRNALYESAAACAFGFIFSFVPILMLIWVFMLGFLRADPGMMGTVERFLLPYKSLFSVDAVLEYIRGTSAFSPATVAIIVFVIWMSHKFFSSVMSGFVRIFRTVVPPRTLKNYLLSFAGALFTVLLISGVLILVFIMRELLLLPIFAPLGLSKSLGLLVDMTFYIIILVASTVSFRVYSSTSPSWHLCFFCATLCAIGFWGFELFLRLFFNVANYNFVYGVLSDLIILIFEVDVFFIMFMYFAQFIYTRQHFDIHFLEELYLLQGVQMRGLFTRWRYSLFMARSRVHHKYITVGVGEAVYNVGDDSTLAFCIVEGSIGIGDMVLISGSFFGERECVLGIARQLQATARERTRLLVVPREEFLQLVKVNPTIALAMLKGTRIAPRL